MGNKDYSHLEGKEIQWINNGYEYTGIVVNVDYDIGVTIVNKDDKTDKLTCLNGPMSPNKEHYEYFKKTYKTDFYSTVRQIKKGLYNGKIMDAIESKVYGERKVHPLIFPSMASCAYGGE